MTYQKTVTEVETEVREYERDVPVCVFCDQMIDDERPLTIYFGAEEDSRSTDSITWERQDILLPGDDSKYAAHESCMDEFAPTDCEVGVVRRTVLEEPLDVGGIAIVWILTVVSAFAVGVGGAFYDVFLLCAGLAGLVLSVALIAAGIKRVNNEQ